MSKTGWIKTYRNIQDHWLWTTEKPFDQRSAWLDIIFRANHETAKIPTGEGIEIVERGSFITSIVKLAESWGWSRKKVARFLDLLESDNMVVRKSNNRRTAVFVVNYDLYQNRVSAKATTKGTANNTEETLIYNEENRNAATTTEQQAEQQTEQLVHIKRTTSAHKQEYIKNNKEKDARERAHACETDPLDGDGPPPKGTPEYERWRNQ